jgi:hypothetical protein
MPDWDRQPMDVQDRRFDQPVVNIGSHADNDIALSAENVLPFHAMVVLQEGVFQIMALDPHAEIRLNGRLLEEDSVELPENHRLEIGDYALIFQPASPSGMQVVVSYTGVESTDLAAAVAEMAGGEQVILVNMLSEQAEVYVDQRATFDFEVINAGPIVARFFVDLQGVPEGWVEIEPDVFNLNEGERATVSVHITPPRAPSSTAGIHDLKLVTTSPNYAGYHVVTPFSLVIQPFYEFALGNLSPKNQRIPWRKRTGFAHVPITNKSNTSAEFSIQALDDENGCSFDFWVSQDVQLNRQATVTIPAGDMLDLPMQVTPLKPAMIAMRSKRYHYTTTAQIPQNPATSPQIISASVVSVPLFGWWSILLGIMMILVGLFILLQPRIRSFEVASGKDVIELGDTTKLEWAVSPFATRLSIDNINEPIERSQKALTIAPAQSTTFELSAGNWLSGLIGGDHKASQTVLVVPPMPNIGVFEVDKTTVDKGTPVKLRWSVTDADAVALSVDEVVFELPEGGFSGEQEYILEKDALVTLTASNASGSEMRSYFINVVPPEITVNTFTVWVKPAGAANTPSTSSGGHLSSRIPIPDPNFPEKLVELIPDPAAARGYRQEYYDDTRELAKGEQVLLEWDIGGVDKINIAPFVDALPSIGNEKFFPQESMSFILTANSGELEEIFMLPVKVFDGEPPEAPKIEFFEGAPAAMVGGGPVEFVWSVSGEWTRIQIASGEEIKADYLAAQGFETISVTATSTFILTAFNNDLSSATPLEITVDPALIEIGLSVTDITPKQDEFLIGESMRVTVAFSNVPEDGTLPSGKVIVTDQTAICEVKLPAKTCILTFTTPGLDKDLTAHYAGDDIYLPADASKYAGHTVNVQNAEVKLEADYFFLLGKDPATNQWIKGTTIDLTKETFDLNEGIYITTTISPKGNTELEDDKKSKVKVSLCEQEAGPAIKSGSCQTISFKTMTVTAGIGTADLIIPNFDMIGDNVIKLDYTHSEQAIDPTSEVKYDVKVGEVKIHFALSECKTDPDTLTDCKFGAPDPADTSITFDFRMENPNADLPSTLPKPADGAISLTSIGSVTSKILDF